jgi:hypothetical protein
MDQMSQEDGEIHQVHISSFEVFSAHFIQLRDPIIYKENAIEDKSDIVKYHQTKKQDCLVVQLKS